MTTSTPAADRATTVTESVGTADSHPVGSIRMVRVGNRPVALVRTESGFHAIDNACPHQGYGLVRGTLEGEVLTCRWHNWRYRVEDGRCLVGEEDVTCHGVEVVDGEVLVTITEATSAERRERLWPSLLRGVDRDYPGQIARDTARLLEAGAGPSQIVAAAAIHALPRIEYGPGHELAMAADCLALGHLWDGLESTLPVTQALAGIAETARDRPRQVLPEPDATIDLNTAIEAQDTDGAMASVLGRLEVGDGFVSVRAELIEAASAHHLGYGHGAIYTQKVFELLDAIGTDHASAVLPWLAMTLTHSTREDTLPYMKAAMRMIDATDLDALAGAADRRRTGWADDGELRRALLDEPEAAIAPAAAAVVAGAGIEGLLDTVSLAVSERLLRYDSTTDFDPTNDFGWLDITHGLTYANAARWAWRQHPSAATARLALFTVFLAHDTGRAERARRYDPVLSVPEPRPGDVEAAILERRPDDAVAHSLAGDPVTVADAIGRASMCDRSGSFIVTVHIVKMAEAARREALTIGSSLPLAAAARFAAAPRLERFVARNVAEAIAFVRTGAPPKR